MQQVHLILGDDEFLTERARLSIQKAAGEGVEVVRLKASEVSEGEIAMATSPSLFGDNRVIVISDVEKVGKELTQVLLTAVADPGPGMTLVLIYTVTAKTLKGKKKPPEIVAKLRKVGEVHEVFSLYPNELGSWATREFASHGVRPTPDVVQAVLDGVGSDLRELASAIVQQAIGMSCHTGDEVIFPWRSFEAYPLYVRMAGQPPPPVQPCFRPPRRHSVVGAQEVHLVG